MQVKEEVFKRLIKWPLRQNTNAFIGKYLQGSVVSTSISKHSGSQANRHLYRQADSGCLGWMCFQVDILTYGQTSSFGVLFPNLPLACLNSLTILAQLTLRTEKLRFNSCWKVMYL